MTNSVEVSAAVPLWPVSYILVTACEGEVRFDDGATLSTDDLTVVWCTGFTYDWGYSPRPRLGTRTPRIAWSSDGCDACRNRSWTRPSVRHEQPGLATFRIENFGGNP